MTVTPANRPGLYDVESERDPETVYVVDLKAQSCSCPHHQYRQAICKHITAASDYAAGETKLAKAERIAETLSDADLKQFARDRQGTAAGAACLIELAKRANAKQPKPIPEGVLALLDGATEAERARALEIYR